MIFDVPGFISYNTAMISFMASIPELMDLITVNINIKKIPCQILIIS